MQEVDARDCKCPMPIVKIAQKIKTIQVGDQLKVLATDPVFKPDIEAWCRKTQNKLVEFIDGAEYATAIIEKTKE